MQFGICCNLLLKVILQVAIHLVKSENLPLEILLKLEFPVLVEFPKRIYVVAHLMSASIDDEVREAYFLRKVSCEKMKWNLLSRTRGNPLEYISTLAMVVRRCSLLCQSLGGEWGLCSITV